MNPPPEHSSETDQFPPLLYGTAWKEDQTQRVVELALEQGFRGIDTANQRKHYFEAAVGLAIEAAIGSGIVTRDDLFLQTKFTFRGGQDHRLPYDPTAPVDVQVQQSFERSLDHLKVTSLESYVLHGPSQRAGLGTADWAAWRAMEELHAAGKVRWLGISNVNFDQLDLLCQKVSVRPRFVQNRCYASTGWDQRVREFCLRQGIVYQGFSLLTANAPLLNSAEMIAIARKYRRTAAQTIFRFAIDVGMLPLTGTTNAEHMRQDLAVTDFQLKQDEIQLIERLGVR